MCWANVISCRQDPQCRCQTCSDHVHSHVHGCVCAQSLAMSVGAAYVEQSDSWACCNVQHQITVPSLWCASTSSVTAAMPQGACTPSPVLLLCSCCVPLHNPQELEADAVALMAKRVYDVAGVLGKGCKVREAINALPPAPDH